MGDNLTTFGPLDNCWGSVYLLNEIGQMRVVSSALI